MLLCFVFLLRPLLYNALLLLYFTSLSYFALLCFTHTSRYTCSDYILQYPDKLDSLLRGCGHICTYRIFAYDRLRSHFLRTSALVPRPPFRILIYPQRKHDATLSRRLLRPAKRRYSESKSYLLNFPLSLSFSLFYSIVYNISVLFLMSILMYLSLLLRILIYIYILCNILTN